MSEWGACDAILAWWVSRFWGFLAMSAKWLRLTIRRKLSSSSRQAARFSRLRDAFFDAFQLDDRQVLSALVMADVEFQPYAGFAFDQRPRFGAG